MPLEPGSLLHNRYRILQVLGHGGMGSVYHAVDEVLQIEVAIKENLFTSPEYAEQFRQEARLLASLRHPNLPRVTDYFVIEGQGQYLIMDFIPGEDLKERIEREGALPISEVLTIAMALCEALEYLHSQHPPVIHRDVKPGNVRLTPEGKVYLVDFGLAKVGGADQKTVTGAQAITPGFSSPEQYGSGGHTDPRSDIYGLAATLYMALTGVAPEDAFERLMETSPLTPIHDLRPDVPAKLAEVIEQALALRPEDRPASVAEFKQQLIQLNLLPDQQSRLEDHLWRVTPAHPPERWRSRTPDEPPKDTTAKRKTKSRPKTPPPPAEPPRKRGGCLWPLLLGLGILALLGVLLTDRDLARRVEQTFPAAHPPLATAQALVAGLGAAPPTATATATTIPPTFTATATFPPTWTPTATATFTPSPTLTPTATFTPTLAATHTPGPGAGALPTGTPPATPFGQNGQLAFASNRSGLTQIWIYDFATQSLTQVTHEPDGACQPAWAPSGTLLAYITPCNENQIRYEGAHILVLDLNTGETQVLIPPSRSDYDPAWSPDGTALAFTSLRNGHPQIYLYNLTTDELTNLSGNQFEDFMPAWAPNGKRLAFVSTRLGIYRIYLMDRDGGNQTGFSRSRAPRNLHPIWSPDGVNLVFAQTPPEGLPHLVVAPIEANGLVETPLTPSPGLAITDPAFSSDGRWLAVEGWTGPEAHDIYIVSANGQTLLQITNDEALDFDPAWRPSPPP